MTEKNFEKVFQDALSHYEADVNPAMWQSVQSGLAGKGAASSAASGASQAGQVVAGLGAKGVAWISGALLVAAGGLYLALSEPDAAPQKPTTVAANTEAAAPAVTTEEAPASQPVTEQSEPVNREKNTTVDGTQITVDLKPESDAHEPASAQPAPAGKDMQAVPAPSIAKPETVSPAAAASMPETETAEPSREPVPISEASFEAIEKYLVPDQSGQAKLPNKFTPNGDGYNDEFTILTAGLKSMEVTVFNPKGLVVFRWNDLQGRWNGLLANGEAAQPGTYFYSVLAITPEGKKCIAYSTLILSEK